MLKLTLKTFLVVVAADFLFLFSLSSSDQPFYHVKTYELISFCINIMSFTSRFKNGADKDKEKHDVFYKE